MIFSIHQPRYSVFKLFDTVLFLAAGQNIFVGSPRQIVPYLSAHGGRCEEHNNPADVLLDLLLLRGSHTLHAAYLCSAMLTGLAARIASETAEK